MSIYRGGKEAVILLVGQTPPPHHGQSVVTGMLFEHEWSKVKVSFLRMAYSDAIDQVGKFSLFKVFHLFSLIFQTWKIALTQRPDVLYYLPSSPHKVPLIRDLIYLSLTRWLFSKTVFHYHAGGLAEYVDGLGSLKWLAHKVYGRADVSIELSENGLSPSDYFGAKKKVCIPNGLNVGSKNPWKALENDIMHVLFIGALNEGKGTLQIVKTAAILKERGVRVSFSLVGAWADEEYKSTVLAEVAQSGLEDVVDFPGILTGDPKWEALSSADCFFFPSHYASENFPLVLIEAMAFGLPIITTDWRGIPNVVGNSGCAYLCDINSPDQYAKAIQELALDLSLSREMGERGLTRYEAEFTKEKFLERMEDVFEEVVRA